MGTTKEKKVKNCVAVKLKKNLLSFGVSSPQHISTATMMIIAVITAKSEIICLTLVGKKRLNLNFLSVVAITNVPKDNAKLNSQTSRR